MESIMKGKKEEKERKRRKEMKVRKWKQLKDTNDTAFKEENNIIKATNSETKFRSSRINTKKTLKIKDTSLK